jgi:hypothetical protein
VFLAPFQFFLTWCSDFGSSPQIQSVFGSLALKHFCFCSDNFNSCLQTSLTAIDSKNDMRGVKKISHHHHATFSKIITPMHQSANIALLFYLLHKYNELIYLIIIEKLCRGGGRC